MTQPKFALYVSSVEGHVVTRPGTPDGRSLIGASRKDSELSWSTDLIVPIPEAEYHNPQFRRVYDRAIKEGALKVRKAEEYQAQLKTQDADEAAKGKAQEKAAKAEVKSNG